MDNRSFLFFFFKTIQVLIHLLRRGPAYVLLAGVCSCCKEPSAKSQTYITMASSKGCKSGPSFQHYVQSRSCFMVFFFFFAREKSVLMLLVGLMKGFKYFTTPWSERASKETSTNESVMWSRQAHERHETKTRGHWSFLSHSSSDNPGDSSSFSRSRLTRRCRRHKKTDSVSPCKNTKPNFHMFHD